MFDLVSKTFGPGGSCVLIERPNLDPLITKDGVTVAKALDIKSSIGSTILQTIKNIAQNSLKNAGDGTTSSIILSHEILKNGVEFLKNNPKVSPQKFVRALKNDLEQKIIPFITQNSKTDYEWSDIRAVANLSSNDDKELSDLVFQAFTEAGEDGSIFIEESKVPTSSFSVEDGFTLQKGIEHINNAISVYTLNTSNFEINLKNALVYLWNGTFEDVHLLQKLIQDTREFKPQKDLILVAHKYSGSVIEMCTMNSTGTQKILPIMTSRDGTVLGAELVLADLGAYVGGSVNSKISIHQLPILTASSKRQKQVLQKLYLQLKEQNPGYSVEEINNIIESLAVYGEVQEFRTNRWGTVFISNPDPELIKKRIQEIKSQIDSVDSYYSQAIFKERIAALQGGVVKILVGGTTSAETKEMKDRVEDSIKAMRCIKVAGVSAGGCSVYLRCSKLDIHEVLKQSLNSIFDILLLNSGYLQSEIDDIKDLLLKENNLTIDLHKGGLIGDCYELGVLEPTQVIFEALKNSLSISALLSTLGGIISIPRDNNDEINYSHADVVNENLI
jgi:chaperonin GroEL